MHVICLTSHMQRESSSTRLLTKFMGISPPPLHYGPAANYGSIIVPGAFHRLARCNLTFQNNSESLATLLSVITYIGRWVMAHLHTAEAFGLRSGMYPMTVYSIFKEQLRFLTLYYYIVEFFFVLMKKISKNFFTIKKAPAILGDFSNITSAYKKTVPTE